MSESAQTRFFPPVDVLLKRWPRQGRRGDAATAALQLRWLRVAKAKRYLGWKLDGVSAFAQLLESFHRACEAERTANWRRADFYWRAFNRRLVALWPREDQWREILNAIVGSKDQAAYTPRDFKTRFLTEMVLDTYRGFYEAHRDGATSLAPDHRAFVHAAHLRSALSLSSSSKVYERDVLVPVVQQQVASQLATRKWKQALAQSEELVHRFPGDSELEDHLAAAVHAAGIGRLQQGSDEPAARRNAAALQEVLEYAEERLRALPANSSYLQALAALRHLLAIQLANGSRIADALVEAERARLINPGEEKLDETRKTLARLMSERQRQIQEVLKEIASRPNATLSAAGHALRRDASKGFTAASQFVASEAARQLEAWSQSTRAAGLLRRLGLPVPEGADEAQALAAVASSAVARLLATPPEQPAGVADAWRRAVAAEPRLAGLPTARVEAFIRTRLFDVTPEAQVPPAPALSVEAGHDRGGGVPLLDWLFSREGLASKALAAVAVVALISASALAASVAANQRVRDAAFARVEQAVASGDDVAVVDAAEAFFSSARPPGGDAAREGHALAHYREALARWLVRAPAPLDPKAATRIAHYRALTALEK